jgi:nucleoside-diphosphate-sugar epimerase
VSDCVVVGAGGTLGRLLAERFGARGVETRCADPTDGAPLVEVATASVVVNAGGPRVRTELGWGDYFREHVGVTERVARSMRPGAHLVHVSSTAVYGARGASLDAQSIEAPTAFPSPAYACAKLAAEAMARAVASERGVRVSIVRPSMVYGPGVDSALETLRRLARRGVALGLAPSSLRQHLVHVDLLVAMIRRLVDRGPTSERILLAADPFVLTCADLNAAAHALPVPLRAAAAVHRRWLGIAGVTPGALEALAVLALDNVFDAAPAMRALGLDSHDFARERTFDAYWSAP